MQWLPDPGRLEKPIQHGGLSPKAHVCVLRREATTAGLAIPAATEGNGMQIDIETREPTGFAIFEDRIVVRRGKTPADERTIIVRDHATLDRHMAVIGKYIDRSGTDHTSHGDTEYFGRFLAADQLPNGATVRGSERVLLFPIPAASLFLAFKFLDDEPAVAAAIAAAVQADQKARAQAHMARSGSILLPGGK